MSPLLAAFGRHPSLHEERGGRALMWRAPAAPARTSLATLGLVHDRGAAATTAGSLARTDDLVAVADASFCYLAELPPAVRRRLPPRPTSAEVVLAAYGVLGERCVDVLDGDFAFVVWDGARQRGFCARDHTGRRALYLAERAGGLVVASRLEVMATVRAVSAEIDEGVVGADAAGLFFAVGDATCMRGVQSLRAGWAATWSTTQGLSRRATWDPQPGVGGRLGFDDAAVHLRELITRAVTERCDGARTAVWMSGGRDSTAVFGAGMHALRGRGATAGSLFPVSRSHPPGDSGREDEVIEAVAAMWGAAPQWVEATAIPMLARDAGGGWRGDSFAQPFENLTRALARATVAAGARVALDGFGGDFLFQVSREYLADVVMQGRLADAVADWRAMDRAGAGWRGFARAAVLPIAPSWARRAATAAGRGDALRRAFERVRPPWVTREFVHAHSLEARMAGGGPDAQPGRTVVERETRFYLTHPFFGRVNAAMAGFARAEGVELRSPLLDRRVVAFALSRPREERNLAGDQKRLLRAAMRGLLPEHVLAPRPFKTGTLGTYFRANMRRDGVRALREIAGDPLLAGRGIVDRRRLAVEVERYATAPAAYPHEEALYCTLMAERWLRDHAATLRSVTACA